jgi:predicted lipid-binding transport protein (Tim44 family)
VSETTTPQTPPEEPAKAASVPKPEPKPEAPSGTPVWVWAVYVLGGLAATVFAGSLAFVAVGYATEGSGGAGVDISIPALVVWLALVIAAAGTFAWRRWGGQR